MSDIGQLVKYGKKRGFLKRSEIIEALPPNVKTQEQIQEIIETIIEMGIEVRDA